MVPCLQGANLEFHPQHPPAIFFRFGHLNKRSGSQTRARWPAPCVPTVRSNLRSSRGWSSHLPRHQWSQHYPPQRLEMPREYGREILSRVSTCLKWGCMFEEFRTVSRELGKKTLNEMVTCNGLIRDQRWGLIFWSVWTGLLRSKTNQQVVKIGRTEGALRQSKVASQESSPIYTLLYFNGTWPFIVDFHGFSHCIHMVIFTAMLNYQMVNQIWDNEHVAFSSKPHVCGGATGNPLKKKKDHDSWWFLPPKLRQRSVQ